MPHVIILQAADAEAVRGPSTVEPNHMLQPMPLSDGTFYLGIEVLADAMHAEHRDRLAALPQVDYEDVKAMIPQAAEPR